MYRFVHDDDTTKWTVYVVTNCPRWLPNRRLISIDAVVWRLSRSNCSKTFLLPVIRNKLQIIDASTDTTIACDYK